MADVADDEAIDSFVLGLNLGPDAGALLRALPGEVQAKVMRDFDPRGTKDGNVLGRLQAFVRPMLQPGAGRQAWPAGAEASRRREAPPERPPAVAAASPEFRDYAQAVGLDESGARFLGELPQDVRDVVIAEFDPRGTKDGNVLGRLLGFARAVWAQRLGLDSSQKLEAAALLRSLPEEAQARVMAQFDVSGTKDGNIMARLQRFASDVASRCGGWSSAPAPGHVPAAMVHPPQPISATLPVACSISQPMTGAAELAGRLGRPPAQGILAQQRWPGGSGLDTASASFIQALPEDVRSIVISSFNPSGTKDGNVWGRLFGFARSVWVQRLGLDLGTVNFLKSLPEETQRVVMVKFDPSRTKDGNIAARLESFARSVAGFQQSNNMRAGQPAVSPPAGLTGTSFGARAHLNDGPAAADVALRDFTQRWGLNPQATAFLHALPETVTAVVVGSFNASGTKDGNVWGRLFGFVRSVWAQKLGLDSSAFTYLRGLPEELQMAVMLRVRQPQEHDALGQLQAVAEEAMQSGSAIGSEHQPLAPQVQALGSPWSIGTAEGDEDVETFVRRCGLDHEAVEFLRELSDEVRAAVIADFDPGGTKDGNVLGRLRGFARSVEGSRKRQLDVPPCGRHTRPRLEGGF